MVRPNRGKRETNLDNSAPERVGICVYVREVARPF